MVLETTICNYSSFLYAFLQTNVLEIIKNGFFPEKMRKTTGKSRKPAESDTVKIFRAGFPPRGIPLYLPGASRGECGASAVFRNRAEMLTPQTNPAGKVISAERNLFPFQKDS